MPFLGNQPSTGYSTIVKDDFTANGNDTVFTLSRTAASANSIAVFVGNVRQEPTDAYTVNGTTLTMSAAPANGANFYVLHISGAVENSSVPASGTIGTSQLANNAVHTGKIADNQITSAKLDTNIAIDGDLTVDTNTLYVDSTSGNVGIGTSNGTTTVSSGLAINNATAGNYPGLEIQTAGVTRMYFNANNAASYISSVGTNPMAFYTNGSESMRIDSSGRVTMPYQPGFRSGTSTFDATTGIATSYATSSSNTGGMYFNYRNSGHFNTSTGRFTAPVSGKYLIQATYSDSDSVERREIGWLFINGSNRGEWVESWGQYDNSSNCIIEYLTANDYVEFARHPAYPYDGVVASVDLLG